MFSKTEGQLQVHLALSEVVEGNRLLLQLLAQTLDSLLVDGGRVGVFISFLLHLNNSVMCTIVKRTQAISLINNKGLLHEKRVCRSTDGKMYKFED